jgi:MFS family permease
MAKSPALPLFIRSLSVPLSTVGYIAAASTIVGIVVSFPAGMLSDIIGRRRVILTAAVVFATAPFLYLLVAAPWQLVLVRIYHGLATAILGPVALAAIADTFEGGRGERMGWYSSATMVGRFLAPAIGGFLILGNDFHWVYLADGVAGVLALLAAVRLPLATATSESWREAIRQQRGRYGQETRSVLGNLRILAAGGVEAVQYFAFGALETFMPLHLQDLDYSTGKIGLLLAAQVIAATLTKPVMGRLSDRYGRVPMIVSGLILGGIAAGTVALSSNYTVIVVLMALFGLGLATVTASTAALVADLSPSRGRGGALGILSSIMDVGQASGPIVTGILVSAYSYLIAFGSVGVLLIVTSLAFGVLVHPGTSGRNGKT